MRNESEGEYQKNTSLLWILAAMGKTSSTCFLEIWHRFKNHITLDDLRKKPLHGIQVGASVIWVLAYQSLRNSDTRSFREVWHRFENQITMVDLRNQVEEGENKGLTLFHLLSTMNLRRDDGSFYKAWIQCKDLITPEDLEKKTESGEYKNIPVIYNIVRASLNGSILMNKIFEEILTSLPSLLNFKQLGERPNMLEPSMGSLIFGDWNRLDRTWGEYITSLIKARNTLFTALESLREKNTVLEKQAIEDLFTLAKNATTTGYLNAFYDVGMFLMDTQQYHHACAAFQNLPSRAKQLETTSSFAANTLFGEALQETNDSLRRYEHLRAALWFTLAITNESDRHLLIQKIAYCYVTKGQGKDLRQSAFINPSLLNGLTAMSSLESCFALFDLAYQAFLQNQHQSPQETNIEPSKPLIFSSSKQLPQFSPVIMQKCKEKYERRNVM